MYYINLYSKKIKQYILCEIMAAILNFKVKQGQNTKNNAIYEFLDQELVKKHMLHKYMGAKFKQYI